MKFEDALDLGAFANRAHGFHSTLMESLGNEITLHPMIDEDHRQLFLDAYQKIQISMKVLEKWKPTLEVSRKKRNSLFFKDMVFMAIYELWVNLKEIYLASEIWKQGDKSFVSEWSRIEYEFRSLEVSRFMYSLDRKLKDSGRLARDIIASIDGNLNGLLVALPEFSGARDDSAVYNMGVPDMLDMKVVFDND